MTAEMRFNPKVRILASVINFSESTLNNPEYLAYNIDLKNLFTEYANADVDYSGNVYIKKVKGFPYSMSGHVTGQRSVDQKKFSCKSETNVLVLNVGELDFYALDDTVYIVAPLLGDISYGFDTGDNLFPKTPDLNNDINKEWFHNNKKNIWDFVHSIKIQSTGEVFIDQDGTECDELKITIPQGQGDFIWGLLNYETPDHDITCSLYLDKWNHTHKIVFDLSYKKQGQYISLYGNHLSTLEIYTPLPDGESVVTTIKRDGQTTYTNAFTNNIAYTTSNNDCYTLDFEVLLNYVEDGIKAEVNDIAVSKNKDVLAEGYLNGRIKTCDDMGDVFENANANLSEVEVIDWDTIKNDTASFIDDVISQARENVDLLDFFN